MRKIRKHLRRFLVVGDGPAAVRSIISSHGGPRAVCAVGLTSQQSVTLIVNDGGVERRETPAEEGQAGDVRRIALLALQGPSASAGAGGGKGQQHTPKSAGIQWSAGQVATGATGSSAVEGGSSGTLDCSGSGRGGFGELTGTSGGP